MKPPTIRFSSALFLLALGAPSLFAQTAPTTSAPPNAASAPPAASTPSPQASPSASSILNPAINSLQQTLGSLRLDKWKTSSTARQETETNISSIYHDLETTLPPLLTTADQAPDSVASVLPAFRNIEALYDVLLRIVQVSRLSAPPQQSASLEQALVSLEGGRRTLGDHLQSAALAQDQKIQDLQATLRKPAPVPATVTCPPLPPPAPTKKRKPATKPKPATTTPAPASTKPAAPQN